MRHPKYCSATSIGNTRRALAAYTRAASQSGSPSLIVQVLKRVSFKIPNTLMTLDVDIPWRSLPPSRVSDDPFGPGRIPLTPPVGI